MHHLHISNSASSPLPRLPCWLYIIYSRNRVSVKSSVLNWNYQQYISHFCRDKCCIFSAVKPVFIFIPHFGRIKIWKLPGAQVILYPGRWIHISDMEDMGKFAQFTKLRMVTKFYALDIKSFWAYYLKPNLTQNMRVSPSSSLSSVEMPSFLSNQDNLPKFADIHFLIIMEVSLGWKFSSISIIIVIIIVVTININIIIMITKPCFWSRAAIKSHKVPSQFYSHTLPRLKPSI